MTMFAVAFMLFAAGPLVAWLPARRLGAYGAWMLLTAGCALIAWIAVGTLTSGTRYARIELAELHHGKVTVYAGYVLAALIAVLLIARVSYRP